MRATGTWSRTCEFRRTSSCTQEVVGGNRIEMWWRKEIIEPGLNGKRKEPCLEVIKELCSPDQQPFQGILINPHNYSSFVVKTISAVCTAGSFFVFVFVLF